MERIPESPFGPEDGRTWMDVRSHVERILRRKFYYINAELLEDALSEVVVDLLGYWHSLPSSRKSDGSFNFGYALQRGCWKGAEYVYAGIQLNKSEMRSGHVLLDVTDYLYEADYLCEADIGDPGVPFGEADEVFQSYFNQSSPSPEELVLEDEEEALARRMLSEMSEEDIERFFMLLGDETDAEIARADGVTRQSVGERRSRLRKRLAKRASEYGLR